MLMENSCYKVSERENMRGMDFYTFSKNKTMRITSTFINFYIKYYKLHLSIKACPVLVELNTFFYYFTLSFFWFFQYRSCCDKALDRTSTNMLLRQISVATCQVDLVGLVIKSKLSIAFLS